MTTLVRDVSFFEEACERHTQNAPVDVLAIARDTGIPVTVDTNLPDTISGKISRDPSAYAGYRITVNGRHHLRRQRFTVAHELGHYALHLDLIGDGIVDNEMYRSLLSDRYERQANRFAADLLMPKRLVLAEFAKKPALAPLADKFDVSLEAMKIRLTELGKAA